MSQVRGRPFAPGNKFGRGRPAGSRNKATAAREQMLDSHGDAITKKCALMALQGDPTALRLCMERLLPPRKQHAVIFKMPPIATAADVGQGFETLLQAVARGQLTPAEGQVIASMLENRRRSIETEELERRMQALEHRLQQEDVA
jgi:hypothetical protein